MISLYQWQGKNKQGNIVSGEINAQSINLGIASLHRNGIQVITITKKRRIYFQKRISSLDIIVFFRQLATLILSGIPISDSIEIIGKNSENATLFKISTSIKNDINAGNELSYSFKKFPAYFDEMTCHLIFAGEKSGTLDIMLRRVAEHKERLFMLKNKIKQALFYPIMILCVATIVTIVMLVFVVPRFTELFQSMHAKLPAFTLSIIFFAHFLQNHWKGILLLFIAGLSTLICCVKRYTKTQFFIDAMLLKLPIIGISLQKFILSSFARSLTTLYIAGIPITEALKILTDSTGNRLYRKAIQTLYLEISAGKQLHFAMQNCTLFPFMMVQMVQIGEESGALEKMLTQLADFYEADLDHLIGHLSRLLEPLIMIILGVVIGGLVIAMYLPIFRLGRIV